MAVQFAWASIARNVPEELFANDGAAVGAQVNKALGMLQDISCGRDLRRILIMISGFFAAAIIGSFCNLLTAIYIRFVSAHTLLVLYEKYQDQVDDFFYNMLGLLQNQYQKLDKSALKGKLRKTD